MRLILAASLRCSWKKLGRRVLGREEDKPDYGGERALEVWLFMREL